jgi:hypothetical protein
MRDAFAAALVAVATLAIGPAATAQERLPLPLTYDPDPSWFSGTFGVPPGQSSIRLVEGGEERSVLLGPDEFYLYQIAFKRCLADLSMRMPVGRAEPIARGCALTQVVQAFPRLISRGVRLIPVG